MRKPRCFILTVGTAGDTLPYIGLGLALRSAGHEVAMAANKAFQANVESAGLIYEELGDDTLYREAVAHPDFLHPIKSMALVGDKIILPAIEKSVALTREYTAQGDTLVIASAAMLGARIAYDLSRFPFVTLHPSPFTLPSAHELRRTPGANLPARSPLWLKRFYLGFFDRLSDRYFGPPVNAVRARHGLPPAKRVMGPAVNSPELILGLFPDWFAQPQPDWPPQTRLTEFPLYDQGGAAALPEDLLAFLDEACPLLIFTLSSWSVESQVRAFFQESVAVTEILGCRGLLLGARTCIPDTLPPGVRHCAFVPHSRILPHAAAMISYVGIGTAAAALAAGVPQIALPLSADQFDNAARLERLGVARTLSLRDYRRETVADLLKDLLESAEVRARCQDYKARIAARKPYQETLRLLEDYAARNWAT